MFICKPDATKEEDFQSLLEEIEQETKLPIEVEAVYSWMAFVSSRQNPNLSVANRFFGLQPEGEYKIRGLALRREDTPLFIAETQLQILQILSRERDPNHLNQLFPDVWDMLQERLTALSNRAIPLEEMAITQTLSRELGEYRVPSPVARAALQLQSTGKTLHMGQRVQFMYTKTPAGVSAWDLPGTFDITIIDIPRYKELLFRAVHEILQPLGVIESVLRNWMYCEAGYLLPPGLLNPSISKRLDLPLFANLKHLSMEIL